MQLSFFDDVREAGDHLVSESRSGTFSPNLQLPVHRWFRYSAGFSADWVASVINEERKRGSPVVFDPFAGSATTLIAAENCGCESWGIDAHPFMAQVAKAKLRWRSDPEEYRSFCDRMLKLAATIQPEVGHYPDLIQRCFGEESLAGMDRLRRSLGQLYDGGDAARLAWLTLVAIIRKVSSAGTAQWQYVLPTRRKRNPANPQQSFRETMEMFYQDMLPGRDLKSARARFDQADARNCIPVPDDYADLVITSPPYPNNYDYADATRLEMCFLGEIAGWGDLQEKVRQHLIVSCSQHVPAKSIELRKILDLPELKPIAEELKTVCGSLETIRETKGGKKTYHLMIACYFRDLANTWLALRRVCKSPSRVGFVIGDSAPYGVYVPVVEWLTQLALAAGFESAKFEKIRDRNIKWKNRKHRVPLLEGRLWVNG